LREKRRESTEEMSRYARPRSHTPADSVTRLITYATRCAAAYLILFAEHENSQHVIIDQPALQVACAGVCRRIAPPYSNGEDGESLFTPFVRRKIPARQKVSPRNHATAARPSLFYHREDAAKAPQTRPAVKTRAAFADTPSLNQAELTHHVDHMTPRHVSDYPAPRPIPDGDPPLRTEQPEELHDEARKICRRCHA